MAITVRITDANGMRVLTPGVDGVTCPVLEKYVSGDGPVTFQYTLPRDALGVPTAALPLRHCHVSIEDGATVIQTARVVGRQLPSSAECAAAVTIRAQGYYDSLRDRKFAASTIFGPVYDGSSLATSPEDAIIYAVSQLGSSVTFGDPPEATGYALLDDDEYAGRPALDVVRAMSAYTGNLVTPFVGAVRAGVFTWEPLDLAFRYSVDLGHGVRYTPADDASRLFTRVCVLWGGDERNNSGRTPPRIVVYPPVIDYTKLPTLVDLVVNAGAEVRDLGSAQGLAEGLYGRMSALELGWTGMLEIDQSATITAHFPPAAVTVAPERVMAGYYIRLNSFDAETMYGDASIPTDQLITHATWDGTTLRLELGDMREASDLTRMVRQTMYDGANRILHAMNAVTIATRDAQKARLIGPEVAEDDSQTTDDDLATPTPARRDYGMPAADTKQNTIDPGALPPMPPTINFLDGAPNEAGVKGAIIIPPCAVLSYTIIASGTATYTATFTRRSTSTIVATVALVAQTERIDFDITPDVDIATNDVLIYTVTAADATLPAGSWVTAALRTVRYYPAYLNKKPITGTH